MTANRFKKSIESIEVNILEESDSSNILTNILTNVKDNILINIQTEEPKGKNTTFYLSGEVDKAVSKVAKQKKISKSKLVDGILKQVLVEVGKRK